MQCIKLNLDTVVEECAYRIHSSFHVSRKKQVVLRKLEIVYILWNVLTVSPYYCRFAQKMVQVVSHYGIFVCNVAVYT
jgi:hypothetical protein